MALPGSNIPNQDMISSLPMHPGSLPQGGYSGEDEFDFLEVAKVLFKRKYFILAIALIAAIVGLVYAISLPNIYKAEVLIIPNKKIGSSSGSGAAGLASQFGGIASLMGVNLGGGGGQENESEVYLAIMRTRPFAEYAIKEFNLMPFLVNNRNPDTGELVDPAAKLDGAVGTLLDGMAIVKATKELGPGLRISFSSKSPLLCAYIAKTLVKAINRYSQYDTIERAKKSSAVASAQLQQTTVAMTQKVLWDIISQKTTEIVLAQAQDDFSFRIIEPAEIPKVKFKPSRSSIVVGFTGFGFLIGILAVLLWDRPFFQKKSS